MTEGGVGEGKRKDETHGELCIKMGLVYISGLINFLKTTIAHLVVLKRR